MNHHIACFRCGESLSRLTLPLTRRDLCPECGVELHVCKMCVHFDAGAPSQCREDDAEDVKEKEMANFCEWFLPSENAYNPQQKSAADEALVELEALFGGAEKPES
jgi:hypothetical protein